MSRKSNFKLYRVWDGIIQRCCNPYAKNYRNYGGRGIRMLEDGETHCLTDWSNILGIDDSTLQRRLSSGWSVEDAFTKPIQRHKKMDGDLR